MTLINTLRPIYIINPITNFFEKLIFKQLSHYVTECNILSPYQPGFRPNFSTTTALLKFTNYIFTASENGQLTAAIFLDLTKAFNIVDHYLLLNKLYSTGISRNSLLWLNSYLHNRRQCVNFTGNQSDYIIVQKGVPLGSSLGLLLFSIFINDVPKICSNCQTHLYVDDIELYASGNNTSIIEGSLECEFSTVQNWLLSNKLLPCCLAPDQALVLAQILPFLLMMVHPLNR